jgi:hypothetical protein
VTNDGGENVTTDLIVHGTTDLLRVAIDKDLALDKLEKILELQERWEKNEARKAYVRAMSLFKQDPPLIVKDRRVAYRNKAGQIVKYDHASLAQVVAQCVEGMARCGLHHSWAVLQHEGKITVTLTITHELGHCESVSMTSSPDDSGSKNSIQAIASAITYLERYTLLMGLGLAPADDDDGEGADQPERREKNGASKQTPQASRGESAIAAFARVLGDGARQELEGAIGKPSAEWESHEVDALQAIWVDVRDRAKRGEIDEGGRATEIRRLLTQFSGE